MNAACYPVNVEICEYIVDPAPCIVSSYINYPLCWVLGSAWLMVWREKISSGCLELISALQ